MNVNSKKKILLFLLACLSGAVQVYPQETSHLIQDFIKSYQDGVISKNLAGQICNRNDSMVFSYLNSYCSDKNDRVREAGWYLMAVIGRNTNNPEAKKSALMKLIEGCMDPNPWISKKNILQLRNFDQSLYDSEAKKALEEFFLSTPKPDENLVRLIGFANCSSLIPEFKTRIRNIHEEKSGLRWAYFLALARMHDAEAIHYCLKKIKQLRIDDETIEEAFPDLIYIRQKESFDYLLEASLDRSPHCHSSNPDQEQQIPCTGKILELIAPYLKDFPLQNDYESEHMATGSEATFALVKNWIKEKYNADAILSNIY